MRSKNILFILITFLITACSSKDYLPLKVVKYVDIDKYLGKWYEIARLPFSQQEGCSCTTAEYEIIDKETIRVINKCLKEGEIESASGKAFVVDRSNNAKLKVQFFWPFKGDYWIIFLDENNYNWAVVGTPSRKYLWILSRTKQMNKPILDSLIQKISEAKFDTTKLIYTNQDCP